MPIINVPGVSISSVAVPPAADADANPGNYVAIVAAASSGDTVTLADGTYTSGLNPPSGVHITALNGVPNVIFSGGSVAWQGIGRISNNGSIIDGCIFKDTGDTSTAANPCLVSGDNNTLKNCGFEGPTVATTIYKHATPLKVTGDSNLFEDCWAFGKGRYVFNDDISASNSTYRRCIGRHDGAQAGFQNEPNAVFQNYAGQGTTWENCISIDYQAPQTGMQHLGDFGGSTTASPSGINGNVHILGCFVVNHYSGDVDGRSNSRAIRYDAKSGSGTQGAIVVKDFYTIDCEDAGATFKTAQYTDVTLTDTTNDGPAGDGFGNPWDGTADLDAKYVDRVNTGSDLWTGGWPNEAVIKTRMNAYLATGWTTSGKTLENYVKGL